MTIGFHTSALLVLAKGLGLRPDSDAGLVLPDRDGFEQAPVTPRWLAELMLKEYGIALDEPAARAVLMAGRLEGYRADALQHWVETERFMTDLARHLDGPRERMFDQVKLTDLRLRDRPRR